MQERSSGKYIYGETFSPEAPKPNPFALEVLSRHIATGCGDAELHDVLNDIYKALAHTEPEVVSALDKLEQSEVISSEDNLVLCMLIIISKNLGSDLDFLRHTIVTGTFDDRMVTEGFVNVELNEQVLDYLQNIVSKTKHVRIESKKVAD
jgi:hypothetical protein